MEKGENWDMEKKYLFFDIDGTLTDNSTKKIVTSAKWALDELQRNGHFVAIATGRAHYKARGFMESIGLHHMVCCGGNGLVINDQLIQNIPLDREEAIRTYEKASALGYGVLAMLDDSIDVYTHNDDFRKQCGDRKEPTRYIIDENFDIHQAKEIYKLYVSVPRSEEEVFTKDDQLGHLRFVEDYLMFQHDRKKEGILDMMEHLQADPKDVVVFGDDYNDLVMFDDRWLSIAIGNACDALKEKADYVTDKNVDDGIWNACRHFGWI